MTAVDKDQPTTRTPQQLQEHYDIEKELADRLRHSTKEQRRTLYSSVYDEIFRRVPHHPQLIRKQDAQQRAELTDHQLRLLRRFLSPSTVVLEVGAGDCSLSMRLAQIAKHVYAVDVSHEITKDQTMPPNCQLILSDGSNIPVPPGSVDVAFSNQLMEHLHPDDARDQLRDIYKALAPGGTYVCITPNRLSGPHDISKFFDPVATGFHLKEYTTRELAHLFRQIGFSKIWTTPCIRSHHVPCPYALAIAFEGLVRLVPSRTRRRITGISLLAGILGITLIARKPR